MLALVSAMRRLTAKVTVLAPDRNWSASGHVKTLHRPLRVSETVLDDGSTAWPVMARHPIVWLWLCWVLSRKDRSGCLRDQSQREYWTRCNLLRHGHAAMEAAIWGVPGVAVSLDRPDDYHGMIDYDDAAEAARRVVAWLMEQGEMPKETILNVNVPYARYLR